MFLVFLFSFVVLALLLLAILSGLIQLIVFMIFFYDTLLHQNGK